MSEKISITETSKVGGGFRVTISTREKPLLLSTDLYHRHQLKAGIVLSAAQLDQLVAEVACEACDRTVGRMLAIREHSAGEIRLKLARKNHDREIADKVVKKYLHQGLIDDARYASMLARRTLNRKPSGRAYLVAVLQRKYIDRALAEQVVGNLLANEDETDLAVAALERKWHQLAQIDLETARRKAYNYLSRRGIGYAAAKDAFETLAARTKEVTED